jgi:hypothetical protein
MSEATKTPWHLWVVGVVGILWNAYGCYDFYMTMTGGEEYLRSYGMSDEMIAYFNDMPGWLTPVWAIGVFGAMLGSILLLLRMKLALPVFIASFAAFVVSSIYQYALSNGGEIAGTQGMIMTGVISAGCIFFIWYAWFASKNGYLR